MCEFPYLKHRFYDVPDQNDITQALIYHEVYLLLARPLGSAKLQYCDRCGTLRLVSPGKKDASSTEYEKKQKRLKLLLKVNTAVHNIDREHEREINK